MLFAGALTGGAQVLGAMADDTIKRRDRAAERAEDRQQSIMDRRHELLYEMKLKSDMAREGEEVEAKAFTRVAQRGEAIGIERGARELEAARSTVPNEGPYANDKITPEMIASLPPAARAIYEKEMGMSADTELQSMRDQVTASGEVGAPATVRKAVTENYRDARKTDKEDKDRLFRDKQEDNRMERQASSNQAMLEAVDRRSAATLQAAQTGSKAPSGYRQTPDGNLQPIPGGPADQQATVKPMPANAAKSMMENKVNLRRAEQALSLAQGSDLPSGAKGDKEATGIKGYLPNQLLNRIDPDGVETRAAIADLGSLVIHERSGAAVTAAEFPRLAPFIPTEKDDAVTVQKKLRQFVANYKIVIEEQEEHYRGLGYRLPSDGNRPAAQGAQGQRPLTSAAPRVNSPGELAALPPGSMFTAPDGTVRRKP